MPQPTLGDVHVNRPLTNISVAYSQEAAGVEFVADKRSKRPFPAARNFAGRVAKAAAARGLMVYPMQGCVDGIAGDHLLLAPPAVIKSRQITWAVERLREAIIEAERG